MLQICLKNIGRQTLPIFAQFRESELRKRNFISEAINCTKFIFLSFPSKGITIPFFMILSLHLQSVIWNVTTLKFSAAYTIYRETLPRKSWVLRCLLIWSNLDSNLVLVTIFWFIERITFTMYALYTLRNIFCCCD